MTLRAWRDDDVAEAVAGHDDEMALWLGRDAADVTEQTHSAAIAGWRQRFRAGEQASFVVEHDGHLIGSVDLTREGSSPAVVRAIIALAESLDVEVIGEGVETPAQLEALKALGCTIGQGFLFSRPLRIDDFPPQGDC